MFERLGGFGFVLYFLFVGGLCFALVNTAAYIADSAIANLTVEQGAAPKTSRVKVGLEAQERAAGWQSAGYVVERPSAPDVSAGALAKGLDDAENHALPFDKKSDQSNGPRVAGWAKRTASNVVDESPGRLILRSLRTETLNRDN